MYNLDESVWKDNGIVSLKDWRGVDWIDLAQDRYKCTYLANTIVKL